jgi:hypothetical protein
MRILFVILLLSLAAPVAARMYQWVDPDTDTPQLSGKPPVWYRSREGGPRVLVFDRDKLVDDTGVAVSEPEREQLRQDALIQAERDQAALNERLLEAKRMQAVLDRNRPPEEEAPVEEAPPVPAPEAVTAPAPAPQDENSTVEAMRALVEQWDARRTDQARELAKGVEGDKPAR